MEHLFLVEPLPRLFTDMASEGVKYVSFAVENGETIFTFIGADGVEKVKMQPDACIIK